MLRLFTCHSQINAIKISIFTFLNVFGHERMKSIAFRTNKEASTTTKGTAGLNLPIGLTLHLIGPDRIVQLVAGCSS